MADRQARKKRKGKQCILVLDSRAVVRKQLQEADSPRSNELGSLFFSFFCSEAFVANLVVPVGCRFFSPLFYFSPLHLKVKSPGM